MNVNEQPVSPAPMFASYQEVAADIARELREHPSHWTQKHTAKDVDGLMCGVFDAAAVCWCLYGHILKRNAGFAEAAIGAAFGYPNVTMGRWNDAAERTVEDVIALCEGVASIPT